MAQGKFVSYLRVSTARQGLSGLGLEAQRQAVEEYLNGGRWKLIAEFKEVESGKNSERPELEEALRTCRINGATLLVAKLDRLARDAHFLLGLQKAGVDFVACDLPQANRLTVGILAVVAEEEARAISARTKAALEAARRRGVRLGNPHNRTRAGTKRGLAASAKARSERAARFAADVLPDFKAARKEGAKSLTAMADALNARKIPAPRGGKWSAVQVKRVLMRLNEAA